MKMRLNKTLFALLFAVSTLLCARTTQAVEKTAFMLDFASGVAIPLADDNYNKLADASFKLSLRAGVIFYITRNFGVAPELQFDYIPVNSDDHTFADNNINAKINRIRALAGGRFIVPFGIGSFYLRVAMGVDYITGSFTAGAAGVTVSTSGSSTAFSIEPGLGVQFNIAPHIVVGFYAGFPISPSHDFNVTLAGFNFQQKFDAVDLDLLATIGFRF
jgi:hypothetical protein